MMISFDFSALRQTTWSEYAIRFLFGGLATAIAGLLAKEFGPVFGGLFLAFPAIFPASATLVEKHERGKEQKSGVKKRFRGRKAAALDARGAAIGSIGLICFALVGWALFPRVNAGLALWAATGGWLVVSVSLWRVEKSWRWRPARQS